MRARRTTTITATSTVSAELALVVVRSLIEECVEGPLSGVLEVEPL
jgi:hypothetical protein